MDRPPSRSRSEPRISVVPLGTYMDAAVRRRETIIRDQKNPPTVIVIRYTDAKNSIQAALVRNEDVVGQLHEFAETIDAMVPKSKQDGDSIRCNGQAVRRFATIYPTLALKGTTPILASPKGISLHIEGVKVSVTPVVLLRRERKGKNEWGAIQCALRKNEPLQRRGGRAVAELIRIALTNSGYENIRPDMCIAIDVFSGEIFTASGSGVRVSDEIRAACREIAARWDKAA